MRDTSISDAIKKQVGIYFKRKKRAVYTELGLCRKGRLRADVFTMSMSGHIVVIEVKSSVRDFVSDKKFESYLDYCNQFYFAMPKLVYEQVKDQIPKGIGTFLFNEDLKIVSVKAAKVRNLDSDIVTSLAIRAAFRSQDNPKRKNKQLH